MTNQLRPKKMTVTFLRLVSEGWRMTKEWPGQRLYMDRGGRRVVILNDGTVQEIDND